MFYDHIFGSSEELKLQRTAFGNTCGTLVFTLQKCLKSDLALRQANTAIYDLYLPSF